MNGTIEIIFYNALALEWLVDPQGGKDPSEASYRHLLDFPFHDPLQKVKVVLVFGLWLGKVCI
jgi:hypothetical protein